MKNLTLIFLLITSSLIYAQDIDYQKLPQIQTRATYTAEVQPDKITLSIILSEKSSKGKTSVEELEAILVTVLKQNNIDISKQLSIKDLYSNFQNYFLRKTDVQKTKTFYLEIDNANTATNILRDLAENNISNVRLVMIDYSKIEDLKIELKGKAVLKAKKQAEEMATALNQKVGPAIFISDAETNLSGYLGGTASGVNINGVNSIENYENQESNLDVSFDNIRVDVTVSVYFRLE